jgi:hypothetical protein
MNIKDPVESPYVTALRRWDFVGIIFAALVAVLLVFLLNTGSLAEWIAKHKHTKVDEIVFAGNNTL